MGGLGPVLFCSVFSCNGEGWSLVLVLWFCILVGCMGRGG